MTPLGIGRFGAGGPERNVVSWGISGGVGSFRARSAKRAGAELDAVRLDGPPTAPRVDTRSAGACAIAGFRAWCDAGVEATGGVGK